MSKMEMAPVRELQSGLASRRRSALIQDIGLLLYLFTLLGAALMIAYSEDRRVPYMIMFAVSGAAALLAAYRFRYLSVGLCGLQMLAFTIYTLFRALVDHVSIVWTDYVWVLLPLFFTAGMQLFVHEMHRMEQTNEKLNEQMESVVLLDPLTGLYNLRALYIDLQRQMAYCSRNKHPICLMVVRLRYADELHTLLSRRHFEKLVQRLAELLSDTVRVEDRCYSVNTDTGEFAILLTCNKAGASIVQKRIENASSRKDAFTGIIDKAIRVDLRIACVEYEEGISNAIDFKHKADSELQYDV